LMKVASCKGGTFFETQFIYELSRDTHTQCCRCFNRQIFIYAVKIN